MPTKKLIEKRLVELTGDKEGIQLMNGWVVEFNPDGEFQIVNRGDLGELRFYRIVAGPYSPVIDEDPAHAFSLGTNDYVDASGNPTAPAMKVKGIIAKSEPGPSGDVLYRGNLTNFKGKDAGTIKDDGKFITVAGERYQLYRLVAENKNRIMGYIAFYLPVAQHDGSAVEILETENLA